MTEKETFAYGLTQKEQSRSNRMYYMIKTNQKREPYLTIKEQVNLILKQFGKEELEASVYNNVPQI